MVSTSVMVKKYLERRPYLHESLEKEIINYSALARVIQEELREEEEEERSFTAIKMALIRNRDELMEEKKIDKKNIQRIYQDTSVEIQNKVCVVHSKFKLDINPIVYSKTKSGFTYIIDEKKRKGIKEEGLRKMKPDQCLITLKSTFELEEVSGVVGHILSALAGRHINITEIISCREDTHIVVNGSEAPKAFEEISDLLKLR